VDRYPDGSYITAMCQACGEVNYGGSAIWDKTSDGLWVADYYVKTPSTDIVMTRCDNDPQPTGGPGNPTTPPPSARGSVGQYIVLVRLDVLDLAFAAGQAEVPGDVSVISANG
jgi:hypothetical protein